MCLYEFLVGIPPFSGQTPDEVFKNILDLNLEFPDDEGEALGPSAESAIRAMLIPDPAQRPATLERIRHLEFFDDVDWTNILSRPAPFVPQPEDETDTGYFDARNHAMNLKVSLIDS